MTTSGFTLRMVACGECDYSEYVKNETQVWLCKKCNSKHEFYVFENFTESDISRAIALHKSLVKLLNVHNVENKDFKNAEIMDFITTNIVRGEELDD